MNDKSTPRWILRSFGFIFLMCLVFGGCVSALSDISFSESERPRYGVPLLQTSFTLQEALGGFDFIGTLRDDDGLRLVRADTIFNSRVLSAIVIPTVGGPLPDTVNSVSLRAVGFNIPIGELGLRNGTLIYGFLSQNPEPVEVELKLLNFSNPLQDTFTLTVTVPANSSIDGRVALDENVVKLNQNADIFVNYKVRTASGAVAPLALAIVGIEEVRPSYAVGTLDNFQYYLGKQVVRTEYLRPFLPNTASVNNAALSIVVTNNAPVPLTLQTIQTFADLRDGSRVDFTTPIDNGVSVNYPPTNARTDTTFVLLDETNSGLLDAVTQFPDSITFEIDVIGNIESLDEDFTVGETDRIQGVLVFDIPLSINFDGFRIDQNFTFGQLDDYDQISNAELSLVSSSTFGLATSAQIYLLDEQEMIVDSLFTSASELLAAASIDSEGNSIAPGSMVANIPIGDAQLDKIRTNPQAIARVFLQTPGGPDVYARLDYGNAVDLSVGLSFEVVGE